MDLRLLNNLNIHKEIEGDSYDWNAYFSRLMVTFWFFVFPCIFLCLFFLLKEANKNKKIVFVLSNFKLFIVYSYVFHNFLFCFLFGAFVFNIFFFLYTFVDTYLLELDYVYEWFWAVKSPNIKSIEDKKFFWIPIFIGFFLHFLVFVTYTYHNLYKTDSYFGESWRSFVRKNARSSEKLKRFKIKYPYWYNKFYIWFLDIKSIHQTKKNRSIVIIDN